MDSGLENGVEWTGRAALVWAGLGQDGRAVFVGQLIVRPSGNVGRRDRDDAVLLGSWTNQGNSWFGVALLVGGLDVLGVRVQSSGVHSNVKELHRLREYPQRPGRVPGELIDPNTK